MTFRATGAAKSVQAAKRGPYALPSGPEHLVATGGRKLMDHVRLARQQLGEFIRKR